MSKPYSWVLRRRDNLRRVARVLQECGQEWLLIHSPHSCIGIHNLALVHVLHGTSFSFHDPHDVQRSGSNCTESLCISP